ncbi:MAG: transposase [Deltaproteobacteria bacterium]|nr:transposase [Deltaproteobacteria bacterium]
MARKPRIEFNGAFYHVITRGNQQQKTFKERNDFQKYMEILSSYKQKYNFLVYAYILMSNHVHLLIETAQTPLSKILQGINQSYTMYFNRKYKTSGHLFQGRYKAILCDRDEYLLVLIKYIHHNPVRAKIVERPDEYEWSSYRHYVQRQEQAGIVDTDHVLRMFSEDKTTARKLFRAYISERAGMGGDEIYRTVDQRILGDEEFIEKVKEKSNGNINSGKRPWQYSLNTIMGVIEIAYGVSLKEIRSSGKDRALTKAKTVLSLVAGEYGYKNKEIADFIQKDPVVITRHLKERANLQKDMEKVMGLLNGKLIVNK